MKFDCDAFISYAHLDNIGLVDENKGWITNFHRALEIRVAQLLGKRPQIWRDPKLTGNDAFAETLVQRLQRVAVLISVVSPRYVRSEWARRELDEFFRAADDQGGVRIHEKARIFKVLKTPVRIDLHPPELQPFLGYEFFNIDPETGRVRELDEAFGAGAKRDFWMKLDDLAYDVCALLESLEQDDGPAPLVSKPQEAIYLAETTFDLRDKRDSLRRDLQQHGYMVLPDAPLPLVADELRASVRADLGKCRTSIHLVGKNYGIIPEGGRESLVELQNELAIERSEESDFARIVWMPLNLEAEDARQQAFLEQLRMDPRIRPGTELLESFFEDLRTVLYERLTTNASQPVKAPDQPENNVAHVYLVYDVRDAELVAPWSEYLFHQGYEVLHPIFDGSESELREYHEENLRICDGALIFFGSANECWLRRKLREIQKSAGYGRIKPTPSLAISLVSARTPEKERFRTHEATVIPQFEGFSPAPLDAFISSLRA